MHARLYPEMRGEDATACRTEMSCADIPDIVNFADHSGRAI
jgi:hypothetical protein